MVALLSRQKPFHRGARLLHYVAGGLAAALSLVVAIMALQQG
ncbi:MAG: hypothetical protein ACE5R4_15390 [Armatimonadota bacterium]